MKVKIKIQSVKRNGGRLPSHRAAHRPMRGRRPGTLLLGAAALAALTASVTACGSATAQSSTGQTAAGRHTGGGAAGAPDASTSAIVACYRAHGDPSFPDPVYDPNGGHWHFAISPGSAPLSTQHACQHLFPTVNASPPVPQAQFQALVRLAECIRSHGVPNWPDPDPDGSFGLPPSLQTKSPAWAHASQACKQLFPSGGIDAHAVS